MGLKVSHIETLGIKNVSEIETSCLQTWDIKSQELRHQIQLSWGLNDVSFFILIYMVV